MKTFYRTFACLLFCLLFAGFADASCKSATCIIVQFKDGVSETAKIRIRRKAGVVLDERLQHEGLAADRVPSKIVNKKSLVRALKNIQRNPEVVYAEVNPTYHATKKNR